MGTAIDMYNSSNIVADFLDPYSEELMKALKPFMKSDYFSASSSSSLESQPCSFWFVLDNTSLQHVRMRVIKFGGFSILICPFGLFCIYTGIQHVRIKVTKFGGFLILFFLLSF